MKKIERQIEVFLEALNEYVNIEKVIKNLPRGYISEKNISGHTYYYLQWREGNKIVSSYVNDQYLNIIRQKIEIRKQNEQLLRIISKDLRKTEKAILNSGLLDKSQIDALHEGAQYENIPLDERIKFASEKFINPNKTIEGQINLWAQGIGSYNDILLISWSL